MSNDKVPDDVGYGRPPKSARFQKGQSGNTRGRPPGRGKSTNIPYAFLGELVTITEDGKDRRVTAAEAYFLHLAKAGLKGRASASRRALEAIDQGREISFRRRNFGLGKLKAIALKSGSPNLTLVSLKMARKLDAIGPSARMALEPWLVEAALARIGANRLTAEEQAKVFKAIRTPHKVKWPEWWQVKTAGDKQFDLTP